MTDKPLSRISKRIHKGAFRRKAEAKGMTTSELSRDVAAHPEDYSTRTKRQAALARTFAKYRPSKRKHTRGSRR